MTTNYFGNIDRRIALALLVDLLNDSPAWHRGDPRMYGAAGDGVTDDTTAVQTAADTGELYLPQGLTFLVTTITVDGRLYSSTADFAPFRALGGGTLKQKPTATDAILHISDCDVVDIRDIVLDGDKASRVSGTQHGLYIEDCALVTVTRVLTRRCSQNGVNVVINTGTTSDVTLDHVLSRDNDGYGISLDTITRGVLRGCDVRSNLLDGVKLNGSVDVVFNGGEITANTQCGVVASGCRALAFTGGLRVHGNSLAGISITDTNGFHLFGGIKVWGNSGASSGTYQGILVVGAPKCTFTGSVIAAPTGVTETQAHGVYLNDCPSCTFVGNVLAGVTAGVGAAGTTTFRASANVGQADV